MRRLLLAALLLATPAGAQSPLVVLTPLPAERTAPIIVAAEAALGGTKLEFRVLPAERLARRIAERETRGADAVWGLSAYALAAPKVMAQLEAYTPSGAAALRPGWRSSAEPARWVGLTGTLVTACFNTLIGEQVFAFTPPTQWDTLISLWYRGQSIVPSPKTTPIGYAMLAGWIGGMGETRGWGFADRLASNGLRIRDESTTPCLQAGRGLAAIGIGTDHEAARLAAGGTSIQVLVPMPVAYDIEGFALLRGGPNPEAAKRLADWAVSHPAMEAFARSGAGVLGLLAVSGGNPAVPASVIENLPKLDIDRLATQREALLTRWSRAVKKGGAED